MQLPYEPVQDTLEAIVVENKRNKVAAKASGILAQMDEFQVVFGLYFAKAIFSASDAAATSLQVKDMTVRDTSSIICSLCRYLANMRQTFGNFWNNVAVVANEKNVTIDMPRPRKTPSMASITA